MNIHPLVPTLQALRLAGQVVEIDLQPLDEAATGSLASFVSGVEISPENAQILFSETEGNPLFIVETARAGLSIGNPKEKINDSFSMPPRVQTVLKSAPWAAFPACPGTG